MLARWGTTTVGESAQAEGVQSPRLPEAWWGRAPRGFRSGHRGLRERWRGAQAHLRLRAGGGDLSWELVGPARAMQLMYLGEPIDASEAERLGLVNEVVPDGEALSRALDLGRRISRGPREAVAAIKRGVRGSLHAGRADSIALTLELSDHLFQTEDCEEGIRAFFEKREPHFEGAPEDGPTPEDAR